MSIFLTGLDSTIATIGLPDTGRAPHAGVSGLQWGVTACTVPSVVRDSEPEGNSPEKMAVAAFFFAAIGLARLRLEAAGFGVVWANDFDRDKVAMYAGHFSRDDDHQPDSRSSKMFTSRTSPTG